jgi:HEAT repeat protein
MARGKFWISTMLATAIYAGYVPQFALGQPAAEPAGAGDSIQKSVATLNDETATIDQRQGAAKVLVSLRTPQSRGAVSDVLRGTRFPQSQIAVARALADNPDPDGTFIKPLFDMLDGSQGSPSLGNAAAEALGIYKNDPNVVRLLSDRARGSDQTNRNLTIRVAAIRGLGLMCDKAAATTLINLLTSTTEPQEIRNPAADALATLSGESLGRDVQAWQQWWNVNRGKSDPAFRNDLLTARAARLDALERRNNDLEQEFKNQIDSEYQHAVATERGAKPQASADLLQAYLVSSNPVMRAEGADLIHQDKNQGIPVPDLAHDQLRRMIGDSDPRVRLAVASALYAFNDRDVLATVLKQLAQEPDAGVRAALISMLGQIGDLSAVPQLRRSLEDDRAIVAASAADALATLAPKIPHDDPLVRQIAHQLQNVFDRTKTSDTDSLRGNVVKALAALHDPSSEPIFENVLNNPNESSTARTEAATGLGQLQNPATAALLQGFLNDDDPSVKLAVIDALKEVGGKSAAPQLVKMLQPGAENAAIQAKAWVALNSFLPLLDGTQLEEFADNFNQPGNHDPAKRVVILQAKLDKDTAAKSDDRAPTLQNIGECFMDEQQKRYDDAVAAFNAAISAYEGLPGTNKTTLNRVILWKMRALLKAGKYDDAMSFAKESISKDPSQTTDMGDIIVHEADDLSSEGQQNPALLAKASDLIKSANNLDLPVRFKDDLRQIDDDVRKAQAKNKGSGSMQSTPGNNGATARTTD